VKSTISLKDFCLAEILGSKIEVSQLPKVSERKELINKIVLEARKGIWKIIKGLFFQKDSFFREDFY